MSSGLAKLLVTAVLVAGYADLCHADRRAFVVGISEYASPIRTLRNPQLDADNVAKRLGYLGFKVTKLKNKEASRGGIVHKWAEFLDTINNGDEVVVYYSGHGIEINSQNFLVPQDSPPPAAMHNEKELQAYLLPLLQLMTDLDDREVAVHVWILDACRENPFETPAGKTLGSKGGLKVIEEKLGSFVFYAAVGGEKSQDFLVADGNDAKGSVFTRVFLDLFDHYQHQPVWELGQAVKKPVTNLAAPYPQHPIYTNGLSDPWCFANCNVVTPTVSIQTRDANVVQISYNDWAKIGSGSDITSSGRGGGGAKPPAIRLPDLSSAIEDASKIFFPKDEARPSEVQTAPANAANAIFLGKRSQVGQCAGKSSDAYPFGCDFLTRIAVSKSKEEVQQIALAAPISPETAVNVRLRVPTVDEKGRGIYTCVVGTLQPKDKITLSGIVQVAVLGDIFYWGTILDSPKGCRTSNR